MSPRLTPFILLLTTLVLLTGCKDRQITAYRAPKDPAAPVPVAPAMTPGNQLPPDHPPVGGASGTPAAMPGGDMATMANTAVPTAGGNDLKWIAPAAWTPKSGSSMRKGSYAVKGNGAEADLAITAFPGDTGGLHANINRWRGQVGLAPASPAELDAAVQHLDGQGLHYDVVDLAGPSGTRLLGAITSFNGNSWFFKLMGPDALVAAEKPAFLQFLQTVQAP
ncbi:hypothetical protein Verru16b_03338 [Lacunisphaera limnophila]|uniref:Lipoprotein n=1 Tax=Lacunisphaera limnophila TaxID=1838286 RepID=A0A1D8AZC0_9BACT|nr:hypothetical protein [Lacunisphaera limnophila]AOS46239.1 hypothetical protein Verru16b_03338 [Lacunisphaera limnophila]